MDKTALLVMDVQNGIVARFADEAGLRSIQEAVRTARVHHIPLIFVRVALRPGYPDSHPRNRSFARVAAMGHMSEDDDDTQIWSGVQPQAHEPVVVKRRVSAFAGSGLDLLLRSMEIEHLVLSGIATSGVVLSTVREAADKDYQLTVLKDACLDSDAEVHRVLMEKIFPRQADVVTVQAWAQRLQ
jgi:nicotinamidase-related amidase